MKESTLIPKTVRIGCEAKFFGLEKGVSDGSSLHIEFEVPEGLSRKEFETMVWIERERIDLMALISERVKGSVSDETFRKRVTRMKEQYAKLKGEPAPPAAPQPTPEAAEPGMNVEEIDVDAE